jgi:tetratricopeptide (TPR) repeat protein
MASMLAVVTASLGFYLIRSRSVTRAPPEVNFDELEGPVADLVRGARQRVIEKPHSVEAWSTLGEVLLANALVAPCVECFAQSERLDPVNPLWPYYQGVAWYNLKELEQAIPCLRRTIARLTPDKADTPRLLLGEALLESGRLDDAEGCFREALQRRPADERAHFDLGLLAVSRKDWKAAREELSRCLDHPSTRQKSRIQLALVCRRLGDLDAANTFYQQARRSPRDASWSDPVIGDYQVWTVKLSKRLERVDGMIATGRLTEALAELETLTAQYPGDHKPLIRVATLLAQVGDHSLSEAAIRRALLLAPDKPAIHLLLSVNLVHQGEGLAREKGKDDAQTRAYFEESVRWARQVLTCWPDLGMAHLTLGHAYNGLGRKADALASLRQAVRCSPESAANHFFLGEALAEAGQNADARSRLEQALRLAEPGTAWLSRARARLKAIESKKE